MYTLLQGDRMSDILFSIITVCYNAEETVGKTIESVLSQTYKNIEYIIVDGKSTDSTCNIISEYLDDTRITFLSEKDTGLYNAMNKAIDMLHGDYALFLNSGDYFVNNKVLQNVFERMNKEKHSDLLYGNVIRNTFDGTKRERYGGRLSVKKNLLLGKMISHQVMFFRSDIIKKYRYDESFRITADFNLLARMLKDRCSLEYIDEDITLMENREGISAEPTNLQTMREEDDRTIKDCFKLSYYVLKPIKAVIRLMKR